MRGEWAERQKHYEPAEQFFRQALELEPGNAMVLNYLGYMFAEKNINLKEAEELIKRALKMQPKSGAFLDSLGWVYYRKGDYRKALEYVGEAAKSDDLDRIKSAVHDETDAFRWAITRMVDRPATDGILPLRGKFSAVSDARSASASWASSS